MINIFIQKPPNQLETKKMYGHLGYSLEDFKRYSLSICVSKTVGFWLNSNQWHLCKFQEIAIFALFTPADDVNTFHKEELHFEAKRKHTKKTFKMLIQWQHFSQAIYSSFESTPTVDFLKTTLCWHMQCTANCMSAKTTNLNWPNQRMCPHLRLKTLQTDYATCQI